MSSDSIFIYTDASYDKSTQVAVSGFLIVRGEALHQGPFSEMEIAQEIVIHRFQEMNNIRAEIRGALLALDAVKDESPRPVQIFLYTDCQTICKLLGRRKNLESKNYISHAKNKMIANADLYKLFYSIFDDLTPIIHWIPGHSQARTQGSIEKRFSVLDRRVRRELRRT